MELEVDPRKLADLAENLDAAAQVIQEELYELWQSSRVLTNAWEGDAKEAYQRSYEKFRDGFEAQVTLLRRSATSLEKLSTQYLFTDGQASAATSLDRRGSGGGGGANAQLR